jgi:hypothetical protein
MPYRASPLPCRATVEASHAGRVWAFIRLRSGSEFADPEWRRPGPHPVLTWQHELRANRLCTVENTSNDTFWRTFAKLACARACRLSHASSTPAQPRIAGVNMLVTAASLAIDTVAAGAERALNGRAELFCWDPASETSLTLR